MIYDHSSRRLALAWVALFSALAFLARVRRLRPARRSTRKTKRARVSSARRSPRARRIRRSSRAKRRGGQLDGPVETRFPDGSIESRTRFQAGRENGIATSYYPAQAGGGLRSQARVEGDEIVETEPTRPPEAALSQAALSASSLHHTEN